MAKDGSNDLEEIQQIDDLAQVEDVDETEDDEEESDEETDELESLDALDDDDSDALEQEVDGLDDSEADDADDEEDADASASAQIVATVGEPTTPWNSIESDDVASPAIDSSDLAKPLIAAPESLLKPAPVIEATTTAHALAAGDVEEIEATDELDGDEAVAADAESDVEEAFVPTLSDPQVESKSVLKAAAAPAVAVLPATLSSRGGWWTIPTLCSGLAIIACSLIIPQTDANRRLAWEREMLQRDFESVHRQVEVNEQFLAHVANDPNLAERLAQRQMKVYREGTAVLDLHRPQKDEISPFLLTAVMPPEPLAPYQARNGKLAEVFLNPKKCLYASGIGLLLIAIGLVMGGTPVRHA